jgi:hypothetical protein
MQAHYWGVKTFYYSLINKAGSKVITDEPKINGNHDAKFDGYEVELEESCESCVL